MRKLLIERTKPSPPCLCIVCMAGAPLQWNITALLKESGGCRGKKVSKIFSREKHAKSNHLSRGHSCCLFLKPRVNASPHTPRPAIDFRLGLKEAQTQKHSFPHKLRPVYAEMQDVTEAYIQTFRLHASPDRPSVHAQHLPVLLPAYAGLCIYVLYCIFVCIYVY